MATKSKFDWNKGKLTSDTIITDNYRNTETVRSFYGARLGKQFRFNVEFMDWMKCNCKTLGDSIKQLQWIGAQNKNQGVIMEISLQFEYKSYLSNVFKENPGLSHEPAIRMWQMKRARRGSNVYEKRDFKSLDKSED